MSGLTDMWEFSTGFAAYCEDQRRKQLRALDADHVTRGSFHPSNWLESLCEAGGVNEEIIRLSQVATSVSSEPAIGMTIPSTVSCKFVSGMLRVTGSCLSDARKRSFEPEVVVRCLDVLLERELDWDLRVLPEERELTVAVDWHSAWGIREGSQ